MKKIFYLITLLSLFSCGTKKLAEVETLGGFRILAIQTSTPELTQTTGLSLVVKPYISDINSGGRIVSGTIDGCIDPGVSAGAEVTCVGNPSRVTNAYSVNTSTLTNLNSGWGLDSAPITIPDSIFSGKSEREKFNGVSFLVIFSFTIDGTIYNSFKKIMVTNRTTLNTNPTLSTLNLNNGIMSKPKNGDSINANYSGAETYNYIKVDGITESRTEKLVMAWYVSVGVFDMPKSLASESVLYKSDPPTGQLLLIGILRDERGGVSVKEYLL